jgi:hypothetical protein
MILFSKRALFLLMVCSMASYAGLPFVSFAAQDAWEEVTPPDASGETFNTVVSVADYVFVGTDNGIYRSTDAGATWAHITSGLTDLNVRDIALGWGYDPAAYDGDGGYVVDSSTTVALATPSGVFLGTVGGSSWTESTSGLSDTDVLDLEYDAYEADFGATSIVYAATPSGVFRSLDDGASWTLQNTGMEGEGVVSIASDWWLAYLYAVTDSGAVYATELYSWDLVDEDWFEVYSGTDGVGIASVVPTGSSMWLTTDSGVRLDDGSGTFWSDVGDGLEEGSMKIVRHDYSDQGVAYAADQSNGIYRTTNADEVTPIWYPINVDLTDTAIVDIHPTPGNGALVYAVGDNGVYRLELSSIAAPYPDLTPPAAITDLSASLISDTSIMLTWTAPGDDMNTGTAFVYSIRYASSSDTLSNDWENAIQTSSPAPEVSGTTQSVEVTGLSPEEQYYFGIKTEDQDGPGSSELSNIVMGYTGLRADFDGNDTVDIFDYNTLINNFGTTSDCDNPADANEDCTVNIFDYNILLSEFGQSV